MQEITLTTKTGKTVILSVVDGSPRAHVPALNLTINVYAVENGVHSCIGRPILIAFEGENLRACAEWMQARKAETAAYLAERAAYAARAEYINRVR